MRELVARCRALMRRQRGNEKADQGSVLKFEEITLHSQECRVFLRRREVKPVPQRIPHPRAVYEVNPGGSRSRDQIIDQEWGHDFMGDNKTVDVHIRWIRKKIRGRPSNPVYLKTVRGFGYRWGRVKFFRITLRFSLI